MTIKPTPLSLPGWTALARIPDTLYPAPPPPLTLLLHGWLGDETVTWVFANRLPQNHLLVAPRGIYEIEPGRFGWVPRIGELPTLARFQPAVESLLGLLEKVTAELDHAPGPIHLVGFSQGAALAYAFALAHPARVAALAGLAGFLPRETEALLPAQPLAGTRVFLAHGTEDETIPIEMARADASTLQKLGASVTTCEDQVGHKLGANCFRGFETFFA